LLVDSHHEWVEFILERLLESIDLTSVSLGVIFEPLKALGGGVMNEILVSLGEGRLESSVMKHVLHCVAVVLECALGLDPGGNGVILSLEFLGVADHLFDILFGKSSFIVGNSNLV